MTARATAPTNRPGLERWMPALLLLLFPLIMTQVGREWTWSVAGIAALVIAGVLLLIELLAGRSTDRAYRAGVTLAAAVSVLLVWVTVVAGLTGNQGNAANLAFLFLVPTAAVGAFAAAGRAHGMARAMLGVAAVQALLTALAVTDPTTAHDPRGLGGVLALSGYFSALWLASAACFWIAGRPAAMAEAAA